MPFVFTSAPTNTSSAYSFFIPAPPKAAPTSAMSDDPIFSELMNATARGSNLVEGNALDDGEGAAAGKAFVTVEDFQVFNY